jgi:hypothetical protein
MFYSSPNKKPNRPHVTPATTNPAGGNIKPAPILVHSINETMNTLANVRLVNFGLSQMVNLLGRVLGLGI